MSDTATVRSWGAEQDPPLAKGGARGRFSKQLIEAFNAAHPDDVYVPAGKPSRRDPSVTPAPTADTTAEALRPDSFTEPPEAAASVTGEIMPQYAPQDSQRVAHVLPVDPPEDAVHEFEAEQYEETP
jgi:hypothetical protein